MKRNILFQTSIFGVPALLIFKCLVIQSDFFGMVKWPFQGVKWPPTRGWKGHFESPGVYLLFVAVSSHFFFPPKKLGASTRKAFQVLAQCPRQTPGDFHQPTGISHHQVLAVTSGRNVRIPWFPMEKGRVKSTKNRICLTKQSHWSRLKQYYITGWWLNQPTWKICSSNWTSSRNRGEHEKILETTTKITSYISPNQPYYYCSL